MNASHSQRKPIYGNPNFWVALTAVFYSLAFSILAWRKLNCFTYDSSETALFHHVIWSGLHGGTFNNYILGYNHFGDHSSFILFLILPIYALIPHIQTLFIIQSLAIGAAGFVFFLLSRRVLGDFWSSVFLFSAYLFYPTIASQHVNQIHEIQFVIVFLILAIYSLETNKYGLFVTSLVLASLGKETIIPSMVVVGIYAMVIRKPIKWALFPILYSLFFIVMVFTFLFPYLRSGQVYRSFSYFEHLGKTPLDALQFIFLHPIRFLSYLANETNLQYIYNLFKPAGLILPLLSPVILIILPDLFMNTSSRGGVLTVMKYHYSITVGTFILISALYGIKRIVALFDSPLKKLRFQRILGFTVFVLSLSSLNLWFNPEEYTPRPGISEAGRMIIERIPEDPNLSIFAPQALIGPLAKHSRIGGIHSYRNNNPFRGDWDFIITDKREITFFNKEDLPAKLYKTPRYHMVYHHSPFLLFKKVEFKRQSTDTSIGDDHPSADKEE